MGNKVQLVEFLDIWTPNRLLLGRNNDRCPSGPLELSNDHKSIIKANSDIFQAWFKAWLISYVPTLIHKPKWFHTDRDMNVGDVVLFLKVEQEFDRKYQYGIVTSTMQRRDGIIREVNMEYQNPNEGVKGVKCANHTSVTDFSPVALGRASLPDLAT